MAREGVFCSQLPLLPLRGRGYTRFLNHNAAWVMALAFIIPHPSLWRSSYFRQILNDFVVYNYTSLGEVSIPHGVKVMYCEGAGLCNNTHKLWEGGWTSPYHRCVTVKSRLGSQTPKREEEGGKGGSSPTRAGLSMYL
jgi:hypothetical protein